MLVVDKLMVIVCTVVTKSIRIKGAGIAMRHLRGYLLYCRVQKGVGGEPQGYTRDLEAVIKSAALATT